MKQSTNDRFEYLSEKELEQIVEALNKKWNYEILQLEPNNYDTTIKIPTDNKYCTFLFSEIDTIQIYPNTSETEIIEKCIETIDLHLLDYANEKIYKCFINTIVIIDKIHVKITGIIVTEKMIYQMTQDQQN